MNKELKLQEKENKDKTKRDKTRYSSKEHNEGRQKVSSNEKK